MWLRWAASVALAFWAGVVVSFCASFVDLDDDREARSELEETHAAYVSAAQLQRARIIFAAGQAEFALYTSGAIGKYRIDDSIAEVTTTMIVIYDEGKPEVTCASDLLRLSEAPPGSVSGNCHAGRSSLGVGSFHAPLRVGISRAGAPRIVSERTDEVLGQIVRCFSTGPEEYCYGEDFNLLKVRWGDTEYTATSLSLATDSDFEPPYPIVDPD